MIERMRLNLSSLAVLAGLLLPCTGFAQAGAACEPQSDSVVSSNACAIQRFQQSDTVQNILYGDVMRALSAHERPALRKDQNTWNRQRSQTCKARHTADEQRAEWPQLLHDCLSAETQARRTTLLHWLHYGRAAN